MGGKKPGFNMESVSNYIKSDKGRRIIIIAGIAGIVLILLSGILPRQPSGDGSAASQADYAGYREDIETRLTDIIDSIVGVGSSKVMVTLQNGVENVYADGEKYDYDSVRDDTNGDSVRSQERENTEKNPVIIDSAGGGKEALIITQIEPKIKGVVVVCDGGDDRLVQQRVINAVTTALDISSSRVCVTRIS